MGIASPALFWFFATIFGMGFSWTLSEILSELRRIRRTLERR